MTVSILGLDISSTALHGCLLVPGQPPILRVERLGKPSEPLIERVRRVHYATFSLINILTDRKPDWIVIEDAYGPSGKARKALDLTAGAIIASAPAASQVALVRCADWRKALGAKNTKQDGHGAVIAEIIGLWGQPGQRLDEHELDAIGITLAWGRILALQETPEKASSTRSSSAAGDT